MISPLCKHKLVPLFLGIAASAAMNILNIVMITIAISAVTAYSPFLVAAAEFAGIMFAGHVVLLGSWTSARVVVTLIY